MTDARRSLRSGALGRTFPSRNGQNAPVWLPPIISYFQYRIDASPEQIGGLRQDQAQREVLLWTAVTHERVTLGSGRKKTPPILRGWGIGRATSACRLLGPTIVGSEGKQILLQPGGRAEDALLKERVNEWGEGGARTRQ